jgi:hypothetical protein
MGHDLVTTRHVTCTARNRPGYLYVVLQSRRSSHVLGRDRLADNALQAVATWIATMPESGLVWKCKRGMEGCAARGVLTGLQL